MSETRQLTVKFFQKALRCPTQDTSKVYATRCMRSMRSKARDNYLKIAFEAIRKAEKVILKHYHQTSFILKDDHTPQSLADKEAEEIIIKTIKKYFPRHRFLGEESESKDSQADYLWIIDPIDGTKNYLRKIPLFATQLALMKKGEVILGISNAPLLKETIYAEKGKGAFLNGKKISVSKISNLEESFLSHGGIGHFTDKGILSGLLKLSRITRGFRGYGDFWSYHLLSEGKIDIFIEPKVKIWDIAPWAIIIPEAGGKITDLKGFEINLGTSAAIATNKILHQQVLKFFSRHPGGASPLAPR